MSSLSTEFSWLEHSGSGWRWLSGTDSTISRHTLVGVFVLGVVTSMLTDARWSNAPLYALGVTVSVLAALGVIVMPRRLAVMPLFVLMICSQDLTQSEVDIVAHGVDPSATLWQLRLLGVSPAVAIFALIIVAVVRLPSAPLQRHQRWLLVYLFGIASCTSLAFGYATSDIAMFVTDAKLATFGLGLMYFRRYFARFPEELPRVLMLFLAMAAGRYALDFAYLAFGIVRTEISGVNRVSVDSAKGLVVVLMMYLLYQVIAGRWRARAAILLSLALMLLIAYATRWLFLTLALGILMFGLVVGARRAIRTGAAVAVVVAAGVTVAAWLRPEILDIMQKRFSTVAMVGTGGVEAIDLTRVVSIVNSARLVWDKHAILVGLGYGSWYTDSYLPYPPGYDLVGGFDPEWIASGRFYRVHDFAFHILLKLGIIGLTLYITSFMIPLVRLWRRRQALRHSPLWEPTVVLWGSLVTVLTSMYWSGKGLLISAFFVAAADAIERLSRPDALAATRSA